MSTSKQCKKMGIFYTVEMEAEIGICVKKRNFNLTRFLMPRGNPPQRVPENVQYDLYAVSSHFGGLNGGHYTAQVKNTYQQRWFNFDDSRVGEIEEKTVRVSFDFGCDCIAMTINFHL